MAGVDKEILKWRFNKRRRQLLASTWTQERKTLNKVNPSLEHSDCYIVEPFERNYK